MRCGRHDLSSTLSSSQRKSPVGDGGRGRRRGTAAPDAENQRCALLYLCVVRSNPSPNLDRSGSHSGMLSKGQGMAFVRRHNAQGDFFQWAFEELEEGAARPSN